MAVRGDLTDLDLLTLLQMTCEEGGDAQIALKQGRQEAALYVYQGQITHAEMGQLLGEEAVYRLLGWENGTFVLERDVTTPMVTIETDWSNLLLEGLRLLDEEQEQNDEQKQDEEQDEEQYEEQYDFFIIDNEQKNDRAGRHSHKVGKPAYESRAPKTRAESLNDALDEILHNSLDIQGVLVVSRDGLVMASRLPIGLEDKRVGAVSAGVLSLGIRAISQLGRGDFNQILARGTEGNVIVTDAGQKAAFVALTSSNKNLGMVFFETREAAEQIAQLLAVG